MFKFTKVDYPYLFHCTPSAQVYPFVDGRLRAEGGNLQVKSQSLCFPQLELQFSVDRESVAPEYRVYLPPYAR